MTQLPKAQKHDSRPPLKAEVSLGTGRVMDLHAPSPDAVCIMNIATVLARLARFAGQGRDVVTVAEHSVIVAGLVHEVVGDARHGLAPVDVLRLRLLALLHDGHEAYIGDMTRPAQNYYAALLDGFQQERTALCARLDRVIYDHFSIAPPDSHEQKIIKAADELAGEIEKVALQAAPGMSPKAEAEARNVVCCLPGDQARELFLVTWHDIQNELTASTKMRTNTGNTGPEGKESR